MYYIEDIFTDEIITCTDTLYIAIQLCKMFSDSIVTDDENEVYYTNCKE